MRIAEKLDWKGLSNSKSLSRDSSSESNHVPYYSCSKSVEFINFINELRCFLLTHVYSQASFCCSEHFSLAVLCVFEVRCTGRASDLLSGLHLCRHKLHDPVA
jgi:hypothetical protein